MKSKYLLVLLSAGGLMLGAQCAMAASAAVREMASVMMNLNHYPSNEEKAKLWDIVADQGSTEYERVIATAISNLNHKVAAEDMEKLRQVTSDTSAPPEVRDLAGIVLNVNHKPSSEEIRKLETIAR